MHFRPSTPEDIPVVAGVLSAAEARLRARGQDLWSAAETSEAAVGPHVAAGRYHLGLEGPAVVGVFRLDTHDARFWPEMAEGFAAYLHKLAVVPQCQGRGLAHALLGHAVDLARARGVGFLRLDCKGGRPKLRGVYESFGFRNHSPILLNGQAYDRFEFAVGVRDA